MTNDAELVTGAAKGLAEGLTKPIADLLHKIFGPAAEEVGFALRDSVSAWRANRQLRLFRKVEEFVEEAAFEPGAVSPKIIQAVLESASVEEDDDLQDRWASLLVNAADPKKTNPVLPLFPMMLKGLTSRDVRFLSALYSNAEAIGKQPGAIPPWHEIEYGLDQLKDIYSGARLSREPKLTGITVGYYNRHAIELDRDIGEFEVTIETLRSQNILEEKAKIGPVPLSPLMTANRPPKSVEIRSQRKYVFTVIGSSFVAACRKPNASGEEKRATRVDPTSR